MHGNDQVLRAERLAEHLRNKGFSALRGTDFELAVELLSAPPEDSMMRRLQTRFGFDREACPQVLRVSRRFDDGGFQ